MNTKARGARISRAEVLDAGMSATVITIPSEDEGRVVDAGGIADGNKPAEGITHKKARRQWHTNRTGRSRADAGDAAAM
jgi:hypothetical protein